MKHLQTNEFYEFLDYRIDARNRILRRGEEIIALTVKEFEVLLMLIENAGQVISKENLLDKIWADTFVEEGTLTRNISYLRKKLAAHHTETQIIETLPKRGYRFLPEVSKKIIPDVQIVNTELENFSSENDLVVRERTLTRIRVEEQISVAPTTENNHKQSNLLNENQTNLLLPGVVSKTKSHLWKFALGAVLALLIGFIAYQNFFRQTAAAVILTSRVTPFSGFPGREDQPSFSPDGKMLTFVWNGGDRKTVDVYVKMIGEGEPVRLTEKDHDAFAPKFSPDGKSVAFFRSFPDRSEIYTVPTLGGAERKIVEIHSGGTSFSWSPDGKTIAVADYVSDDISKTGIVFVDVESGKKQILTVPPDDFKDFSPRFSRDGKSIAFLRGSDANRQDLYVTAANNDAAPRRVTFDDARIFSLDWNADGANIIFNSKRKLSSANIWQVAAAGGEPELIVTNAKNPTNIAVAPDGKSIAFVESFNEFNVRRFDVNPANYQASPPKLISYIRQDHSPQISPDGAFIAFVSNRSGQNEIWLADAEGKNQRQLTVSVGAVGSPRFSFDGKSIAYDLKINGKSDIYAVSIEGGTPRNVTNNPAHDVIPSWSADSKWIFFCSDRSGRYQIWKTPADGGGEAIQITNQGGIEAIAAPDGKTVYYLKENGTGGLWRTSTECGAETAVVELDSARNWRSWTITQKGIYFISNPENSPYRINFYDFSVGKVAEVTSVEKMSGSLFPALSATFDSSKVLFSQQDQNANSIMIAEFQR